MTTGNGFLEQIIAALKLSNDSDALHAVLLQMRNQLGVKHAAYQWLDSTGKVHSSGSIPKVWIAHYRARQYVRIDPVMLSCAKRFNAVNWNSLDWSGQEAREFRRDSITYGMGSQGYTVPVRGPNGQFGLFSVNDCRTDVQWAKFIERHQRDLILLAQYLNQKVIEIGPALPGTERPALSPREVDALALLAMGYSRTQAALALSISVHTLRVYIEGARRKLGAANTTHAVALAINARIIVI
ncbi:MAG: helix-turn-helix transcriptional regulator [Sulfitobacter sp.]